MKLQNFIDGLEILKPYYANKGESFCLSAEHDIFGMDATAFPLTDNDAKKMFSLGWFQDGVEEITGIDGESSREYFPDDGWNAFV